jgi:hypothetical protein
MNKNKLFYLFALLIMASTLLSACGPSSSSSACTLVVGNGTYDKNVHQIIYPDQTMPQSLADGETTKVVPCNYRNFLIVPKNDKEMGDWTDPLVVTLNGVNLDMYASVYWMVNQDPNAMKEFYKFGSKFAAFDPSEDKTGNENFSTTGWNGMLREYFPLTLLSTAEQAIFNINNNYDSLTGEPMEFSIKITDELWKNQDRREKKALGDEKSRLYKADMAKRAVSSTDMFCGSTNSSWADPNPLNAGQPGNTFNCGPVGIEVGRVSRSEVQDDTGSQSLIDANQAEWLAAYELYHEQTDCWLGIQRTAEICAQSGSSCIITIDAGSCNIYNADGTMKPTTIVLPSEPNPALAEPPVTPAP